MTVRRVSAEDMKKIFVLTNEDSVRKASFKSRKIEWDEHIAWFSRKLSDKNCYFYIGENDSHVVGQVRFDVKGEDATISISLSNELQGKGFGRDLFTRALADISSNREIRHIYALIKKENTQSISFFNKLGFIFKEELQVQGNVSVRMELSVV